MIPEKSLQIRRKVILGMCNSVKDGVESRRSGNKKISQGSETMATFLKVLQRCVRGMSWGPVSAAQPGPGLQSAADGSRASERESSRWNLILVRHVRNETTLARAIERSTLNRVFTLTKDFWSHYRRFPENYIPNSCRKGRAMIRIIRAGMENGAVTVPYI